MAPEVGAVVDRLGPTGWCAERVMSSLDVLACCLVILVVASCLVLHVWYSCSMITSWLITIALMECPDRGPVR